MTDRVTYPNERAEVDLERLRNLLISGLTTAEVARTLGVSPSTVTRRVRDARHKHGQGWGREPDVRSVEDVAPEELQRAARATLKLAMDRAQSSSKETWSGVNAAKTVLAEAARERQIDAYAQAGVRAARAQIRADAQRLGPAIRRRIERFRGAVERGDAIDPSAVAREELLAELYRRCASTAAGPEDTEALVELLTELGPAELFDESRYAVGGLRAVQ